MFSRFSSYYEKFADGKVVCIDDEIPFEIPESWQWERWGNLSYSIQYGYNAPAEETGDIRMVRISDIQDGEVLWATVPFCHINESEIDTYLLKKDDILFARTGGTVGKSFLVNDVPYPSIYAGYLIRTRYSNMLSAKYMKYFMECELYWEQLRNGTIATAQPNCNGKTLAKMILPIPPYNEQIRITDKLNQVLEQVRRYGESQDRLDKLNIQIHDLLKKSILQEAIQGRLVPQNASEEPATVLLQQIREEKQRLVAKGKLKKKDVVDSDIFKGDDNKYYEQIGQRLIDITDDIPFDIPINWVWTRIGYLFAHNNGKQLNKGNSTGTLMEYITTSNLYWDGFRLDNLKMMPFEESEIERCQAIKGDLLVCEGGDVGRSCIWTYDSPIMLQNHIHKLRAYQPLCTKYFFYIFYLYNLIGLIGGKGIGIQGFSAKALHNTIIPLPPLKEQERIVQKIETVFDKIKV
ncbi:MAG: restriction endonuclease subunit S [Bacteroidaceae bacterium]|nr:restriction endonuclease subunit S [Bacteroidaceae bacterium]